MRCADAPAAIVADDGELVEAETLHHFDLIERHRALRVVGVVLAVRRLAAVAVAAQVRRDHRVVLRQLGRDQAHRDMRLRRAVHQQQRRTRTGVHEIDLRARGLDARGREAREEPERVPSSPRCCLARCGLRRKRAERCGVARPAVTWSISRRFMLLMKPNPSVKRAVDAARAQTRGPRHADFAWWGANPRSPSRGNAYIMPTSPPTGRRVVCGSESNPPRVTRRDGACPGR